MPKASFASQRSSNPRTSQRAHKQAIQSKAMNQSIKKKKKISSKKGIINQIPRPHPNDNNHPKEGQRRKNHPNK